MQRYEKMETLANIWSENVEIYPDFFVYCEKYSNNSEFSPFFYLEKASIFAAEIRSVSSHYSET